MAVELEHFTVELGQVMSYEFKQATVEFRQAMLEFGQTMLEFLQPMIGIGQVNVEFK